MRAVTYHPDRDQFVLSHQPMPAPGPGEVLVRVEACGLNPVDAKIHLWHGQAPSMSRDWVPGLDVAGEIVGLGEGVEMWKLGDRVLYHGDMFRPHGGFAEYAVHAAGTLLRHPAVSPAVAAATPCAGWTAWRALIDRLKISAHDSLFVAGGAGGVGSFALQIARDFGVATRIATCSAANTEFVHQVGATHVLDYQRDNVLAEVQAITGGQGVSKALDAVGGDNDILAASALGYEGQMVELVRTVRPESYPQAFMLGLGFHQLSLGSGHRNGARGQRELVAAGEAFSARLEAGAITVPQLTPLSLDLVPEALMAMREQRTVGKLVLVND
ncbi:alcohol dehydrogenase catalytic domain-containing protein [Ferrimonas balearica]|uniref:alcohol dehydrogenase catalytic domain-containing protein n=1 Tax=Ferrimonas balearica TaxID=44012 RepID=UPI001C586C00|nr:zinc-binding dehydrogenase [Ferrimonas balearica]MBW3163775.1 zinc-binding dehydrogenase [Ferrimonas balearica]MBY6223772.1 zinc-binding dehydrogenase [Ferrimonas balearica]